MSAALILGLLLQAAAAPQRPPASMADLPAWSKAPSADDMTAAWPQEARRVNYVGSAVIARHRAQAAADLAALAAAVHLADGTACTKASAVARAMRTAVTQCVVEDLDVIVTVDAPLAVGRMDVGPARAAARAGPADNGSS